MESPLDLLFSYNSSVNHSRVGNVRVFVNMDENVVVKIRLAQQ
jgi:hypothetical protein